MKKITIAKNLSFSSLRIWKIISSATIPELYNMVKKGWASDFYVCKIKKGSLAVIVNTEGVLACNLPVTNTVEMDLEASQLISNNEGAVIELSKKLNLERFIINLETMEEIKKSDFVYYKDIILDSDHDYLIANENFFNDSDDFISEKCPIVLFSKRSKHDNITELSLLASLFLAKHVLFSGFDNGILDISEAGVLLFVYMAASEIFPGASYENFAESNFASDIYASERFTRMVFNKGVSFFMSDFNVDSLVDVLCKTPKSVETPISTVKKENVVLFSDIVERGLNFVLYQCKMLECEGSIDIVIDIGSDEVEKGYIKDGIAYIKPNLTKSNNFAGTSMYVYFRDILSSDDFVLIS